MNAGKKQNDPASGRRALRRLTVGLAAVAAAATALFGGLAAAHTRTSDDSGASSEDTYRGGHDYDGGFGDATAPGPATGSPSSVSGGS